MFLYQALCILCANRRCDFSILFLFCMNIISMVYTQLFLQTMWNPMRSTRCLPSMYPFRTMFSLLDFDLRVHSTFDSNTQTSHFLHLNSLRYLLGALCFTRLIVILVYYQDRLWRIMQSYLPHTRRRKFRDAFWFYPIERMNLARIDRASQDAFPFSTYWHIQPPPSPSGDCQRLRHSSWFSDWVLVHDHMVLSRLVI